jgi:predicted ATP-grasp superfamily ATP-dependent carboligase
MAESCRVGREVDRRRGPPGAGPERKLDLTKRVRVLVSEGSSLSARESITALGLAGCHVEVCDPDPLCLARFSRFVRRVHRCPHFGSDPTGYDAFVRELLTRQRYDVLYPAHEQVYLFARRHRAFARLVGLPVPPFAAIEAVQGKVATSATLERLGIPTPPTAVVRSEGEVRAAIADLGLPCFVKADIGTASRSIWKVDTLDDLEEPLAALGAGDALRGGAVVQGFAPGTLERVYAVAEHGRLIATHAVRQLAVAVGGGDVQKVSVERPAVRGHVARLVEALGWNGALSIDSLRGDADGSERFVDVNPRLAEPGNALAAGLDLPMLLVRLALGEHPDPLPTGRAGVRTHMGLQALLKAAGAPAPRRAILRTLAELARRSGAFGGSDESLTPLAVDPPSAIPLAFVIVRVLAAPRAWRAIAAHQIGSYALTDSAARQIRAMQDDEPPVAAPGAPAASGAGASPP